MPHSSVTSIVAQLRDQYPNAPFLALGQTVLWDEPVKAAWRLILDQLWPDAHLVAGVHDTDYFAKSTALVSTDDPYALLAHNDGATRGLWSAAGEMSTFLGSEDVPTRAMYESNGIPFSRLAANHPGGKTRFFEDHTTAWGWRGIVATGSEAPIAHDVPLTEFAPVLRAEMNWAFETTLETMTGNHRSIAELECEKMRGWVDDYIAGCRGGESLSDLYRHLLPRLYENLLETPASNLDITHTVQLLKFDAQTASLPRFSFVDLFLDPSTRQVAIRAYNRAVAGGGMYTLDTFGENALPFDVVVPGQGRGTLRVHSSSIEIDWHGGAQRIQTVEPITNVAQLASTLADSLGDTVVLVGKAVSLINMLAAEYIVLFHETASGYTPRTAVMNDEIRAAGIALDLKPIVRIAYPTWDALATANIVTQLQLPPHLSRSFGTTTAIRASEFSEQWRNVVAAQGHKIQILRETRKPREVLALLEKLDDPGPCWPCVRSDYDQAIAALKANYERLSATKHRITQIREQIVHDTEARVNMERHKGDDFRSVLAPLISQLESADDSAAGEISAKINTETFRRKRTFDDAIEGCRERITAGRREIRKLRADCRSVERSPEAVAARATLTEIATRIDTARLRLVQSAFITSSSLPHTQARPSAWWLPVVDPTRAWFRSIAEGTEARLEVV